MKTIWFHLNFIIFLFITFIISAFGENHETLNDKVDSLRHENKHNLIIPVEKKTLQDIEQKVSKINGLAQLYKKINYETLEKIQDKLKTKNETAFIKSAPLVLMDSFINNKYEYVFYMLLSSDLSVIEDIDSQNTIKGLSNLDKAMEKCFIFKNLMRSYPERKAGTINLYEMRMNKIKQEFKISDDSIKKYYNERTIADLKKLSETNHIFTYYIPGTQQINPEMNIILQYLLNADRPEKKNAVLKLFIKFSYEAGAKGKGSPQWQKDDESRDMMGRYGYDDIGNIINQADESIRLLNK
jgi:hypothetical protein